MWPATRLMLLVTELVIQQSGKNAQKDAPSRLPSQLMVYVASCILAHDGPPVQQGGGPLWLQMAQVVLKQLCVCNSGDQGF